MVAINKISDNRLAAGEHSTTSTFMCACESSWNGSGPSATCLQRLWQLAARRHGDEKTSGVGPLRREGENIKWQNCGCVG